MFFTPSSDGSHGPAELPASGPRSTRGPVEPAQPAPTSPARSEQSSDHVSGDAPDAPSSVGPDAPSSVGPDAVSDAGPDVVSDLGSDATAEVVADVGPAGGTDIAGHLEHARSVLAALTAAVPERANTSSLEDWLSSFRRLESVVAGLRARLVGCVQSSQAHEDGGHAATTSYLRDQLGVSGREAKRQDVIARDLRQLPGTRAALAAGEIGPEQAQAIGEAARRGALGDHSATEELLLDAAADQGSDEFRRHIKRQEQEADRRSLERDEQRAYRRRRASLARRSDGMWDLHALLTDEDGETLATALDAFRTPDAPGTPIPEQRAPEQRTADALVDVVGAALRGDVPTSGGVRPHLSLVIPVELLEQDSTEVATAGHGGVLSAAAAARLLCDANIRRILSRGDSEVLDVGRSKREWSVAQRQALHVRDGGCRGPGCDRPAAWTDAHHIKWWTKNGVTSVDNGILLCRRHHRMVHEGGWTVSLDVVTALATFRSPTGREIETRPHRWRADRATGVATAVADDDAEESFSPVGAAHGADGSWGVDQAPTSTDAPSTAAPSTAAPSTGRQASLDIAFSRPGPVVVAREEVWRGDDLDLPEPGLVSPDRPGGVHGEARTQLAAPREGFDRPVVRERRADYCARSGPDPPRSRHGPAPPRTSCRDHREASTVTGGGIRPTTAPARSDDRSAAVASDTCRGADPWPECPGEPGVDPRSSPAHACRSTVGLRRPTRSVGPHARPTTSDRTRRGTFRRPP